VPSTHFTRSSGAAASRIFAFGLDRVDERTRAAMTRDEIPVPAPRVGHRQRRGIAHAVDAGCRPILRDTDGRAATYAVASSLKRSVKLNVVLLAAARREFVIEIRHRLDAAIKLPEIELLVGRRGWHRRAGRRRSALRQPRMRSNDETGPIVPPVPMTPAVCRSRVPSRAPLPQPRGWSRDVSTAAHVARALRSRRARRRVRRGADAPLRRA